MPAEVQQKEIKAGLSKQKLETGHLQGPFKLWGRRPRRRREMEEGGREGMWYHLPAFVQWLSNFLASGPPYTLKVGIPKSFRSYGFYL